MIFISFCFLRSAATATSVPKKITMSYHYIDILITIQQRLKRQEFERIKMFRIASKQNNSSPTIEKVSVLKEIRIHYRTMIQRKHKVYQRVG